MLVLRDDNGLALLLRDRHRRDLGVEEAGLLRGHGLELRGERHAVLRLALDLEVGRHVLRRLRHRIDAVLFLHQLVDEAPADGGVVDRVAARERALGLRHHEGCAAHAFYAAGDHQARFAALDGARRGAQRIEPRAAQAVDGCAGHLRRQAGEQRGHARHVAVVLAGLVGAAVDHVGDRLPVDPRVARHQRPQRNGAEVVGAHRRQRAAVAAEGRADRIADVGMGHGCLLGLRRAAARRSAAAARRRTGPRPFRRPSGPRA